MGELLAPVEAVSHPPPVENLPADVVLVAETESFSGETLQLALSKPGGGDGDKVERDHEYDGDGRQWQEGQGQSRLG